MTDSLRMVCNVLNSLPNSVVIYDKDGRIVDANQAACLTHGVEEISDIELAPEQRAWLEKALLGEYCTSEYKIRDKRTGKERWLKVHCNPVYTDSDTPVGVSFFEKDITSQKEITMELLKLKVKE